MVHLKLFVRKKGRRPRDVIGNICALKQGRKVGNIKPGFPLASYFVRTVEVSKGMNSDVCFFKRHYVLVKIWEKHLICLCSEMRSLEAKWNLRCHVGQSETEKIYFTISVKHSFLPPGTPILLNC